MAPRKPSSASMRRSPTPPPGRGILIVAGGVVGAPGIRCAAVMAMAFYDNMHRREYRSKVDAILHRPTTRGAFSNVDRHCRQTWFTMWNRVGGICAKLREFSYGPPNYAAANAMA